MILYNEIESFAAEWLRRLTASGLIAAGSVDETSVEGIAVTAVRPAVQFHAFAGIGVWSHALRLAGWPDDCEVWTGSCPCQPFSTAGRRKGADDARHLWPSWHALIRECRPPVVFGEQVASPDGRAWLRAVQADVEALGYSFAGADLCAAGVGAPHIRQRLFWVAIADGERLEGVRLHLRQRAARPHLLEVTGRGEVGRLGDADGERARRDGGAGAGAQAEGGGRGQATRGVGDTRGTSSAVGVVGDPDAARPQGRGERRDRADQRAAGAAGVARGMADDPQRGCSQRRAPERGAPGQDRARPSDGGITHGFWSPCDWLPCADGKYRPVEPGTFPLAHGAPARVGRLRAYGNAIVSEVAVAFIESVMEILCE